MNVSNEVMNAVNSNTNSWNNAIKRPPSANRYTINPSTNQSNSWMPAGNNSNRFKTTANAYVSYPANVVAAGRANAAAVRTAARNAHANRPMIITGNNGNRPPPGSGGTLGGQPITWKASGRYRTAADERALATRRRGGYDWEKRQLWKRAKDRT